MKSRRWQSLAACVLLAGVLTTEHGRAQIDAPTVTNSSVLESGVAQILQAKVRVQPPRVNKDSEELVSTVSISGVIRSAGQVREVSSGKFVRALLTERILSRTVLEEMAKMGLIEMKDGYSLVMAGPLEGDLELFAMPRRGSDLEPVPVPAEIISLLADNDRGVGSFSATMRDDEVTRYRANFYQELIAQWMNYEGSTNRVELRGIAKGTSVLKFYRPPDDDERVPYDSISLSADLSGFNDGLPVLDFEAD